MCRLKFDRDATNAYYLDLDEATLCDCSYCKNYRRKIRAEYPQVAAYLETMGINVEKPYEVSPLESDIEGMLEYCCCQYIVRGQGEKNFHHELDGVTIRMAWSYPEPRLVGEYFVIEMFPIRLSYDG